MESLLRQLADSSRKRKDTEKRDSQDVKIVGNADKRTKIVPNERVKDVGFLIVGAQKAGTMAAVKNLNKHPDLFVLKEIHFFDLGWHSSTPEQYRATFREELQKQQPQKLSAYDSGRLVLGEKTPEYIYVDECPERIKQVLGTKKKFIFFIRDPVLRAYSGWNMNVKKNREVESFEDCVDRNLANLEESRSYGTAEFHYVQRGFYFEQIKKFLEIFPNRDNFLVVIAERIQRNPVEEYRRIFNFLGVNPNFKFAAEDEHVGAYSSPLSNKLKQRLFDIYAPHNERLFQFLGFRIKEWEGYADEPDTQSTIKAKPGQGKVSADAQLTYPSEEDKSPSSLGLEYCSAKESGDFAQLCRANGTDKVAHHGYNRYYPRYLEMYRSLRYPDLAMMEIGVDRSNSLKMWLEYFPNAFIYGIDIFVSDVGPRHKIFQADQSNKEQMKHIAENEILYDPSTSSRSKPRLFFIIDDGSHIPEHQCFDYFFDELLMYGGCYIIEDIETSYWTKNSLYGYPTKYGYGHPLSVIEVFKQCVDDINSEYLTEENRGTQEVKLSDKISLRTRRLISTITFGQNCIVIMKKTVEEMRVYEDRPYRFEKNL